MQPPIHTIRDRLLQGVDKDYNVVDMAIVVEVISQLEKYAITKEALEATRLGKHINELRRKASDKQLASRAKSLVKKWRELLMPTSGSGTATPVQQQNSSKDQVSQAQQVQVAPPVQVVQPNNMAAAMAQRLTNGHGPHHNNHHRGSTPMGGQVSSQPSSRLTSPAVSSSSRLSPGLSTPTGLGGGPNNVPTARVMPISSSSMPSSASSSPGLSRPTTPNHHHNHQNHHSNHNSRPVSPAVPKTNAANKRLRKEMLETDGPDEDSIVNVTDLSTNTSSPAAKKAKTSSKKPTLSPPINNLINGSSSSVIKSNNKPNCDTASNGHTTQIPVLEDDKASERVRGMSNIEDQTTPKKALQTPKVSRKKAMEQEREHLLEQKVLSARRQASKVKTTQELVQELALRSSTPTGPVKTSSGSSHLVNETKTELMNRFFESQNGNGNNQHSDVLSPPLSDGPPSPTLVKSGQNMAKNATNDSNNKVQSVEDILAQLPPIDTAAILAEINSEIMQNSDEENSSNHDGEKNDNDSDVNNDNSDVDMATESDQEEIEGLIPIPVTKKSLKKTRQNKTDAKARENSNSKKKLSKGVEAALVDELHAGQHESVNGNFNHDGAFKEWHEVVTKETVNGDLLYILPYSVID